MSDEELIRKQPSGDFLIDAMRARNAQYIPISNEEEEFEAYEQSMRNPSLRLQLESTSVFYSKAVFPTSLGMMVTD